MAMPECVVFFGSGAVENAWAPVLRALQANGFPDVKTADGANFALARLVYIGRFLFRDQKANEQEERERFRRYLSEMRHGIATELMRAGTELRVRPEFEAVLDKVALWRTSSVGFVTTNWDPTLADTLAHLRPGTKCFPLHGDCIEPEQLYLPSEIVDEPYRTDGERARLSVRRSSVASHVGHARRIVLYGLSLSALDAELGQVMASGMHASRVREIHVVDPCYEPIVERVVGLTDIETDAQIRILASRPDALDGVWERPMVKP